MSQKTTKLRKWRESAELSLSEVAALTGFSASMLSRAERGERVLAPLSKVQVARRLRVPLGELFDAE